MKRRLAGLVGLALSLVAAGPAIADPPQFKNVLPYGIQRGVTTEVTLTGSGLAGNPELVAPFPFELAGKPTGDGGSVKLKLTVPTTVPLGTYPVRVRSDEGISSPLLLAVGQVPQVTEAEPNNTFETAKPVPAPPVAVEGEASGNDVDYFRFPGKKGQRIVVDAMCARIGSGVDPQVRLTTASGAFVASADDTAGLMTDARIVTVLPEDGDYVLEVSDSKYQGGGRAIYRLVIGPLPVADEIYPLGGRRGETVGFELRGGTLGEGLRVAASRLQAPPLTDLVRPVITNQALGTVGPTDPVYEVVLPVALAVSDLPEVRESTDPAGPELRVVAPIVLNGRIDPAGDEDRFTLAVTPGQTLRITVQSADLGSALDGVLRVLKPDGSQLASADDTNPQPNRSAGNQQQPAILSPDPSLTYNVPAGTTEVVLALRDLNGRGGVGYPYRIKVEALAPGFDLALSDSEISIPRGGTSLIGVTLTRRNYTGPVSLTVEGPPPGVTIRPGTVAGGQNVGALSISAAPDADFGAVTLKVVGTAQGPNGAITEVASRDVVFAQQGNLPLNAQAQWGLAAAPASAALAALDAPAEPVDIVHGIGGAVTIKVKRPDDAEGALTLEAISLPTGVTVPKDTKIAEKAAEGTIPLTVGLDAPVGAHSVGFTAKGKLKGKDLAFAAPVVTFNIVRPVVIELEKPAIEIKPGETIELKGKVLRKGDFKEPVTVKLTGLPGGLGAEPATVAPEASEFVIKIVAEANAAPATENALASAAFQINKKDYPAQTAGFSVKIVK